MSALKHRLRFLTIKPTAACDLRCPYCDSRQRLFETTRGSRVGLDEWARLFVEASELGTEYLDISGGEPTLYEPLDALVWEAKRHGWFVSMNSNGQQLTPSLVERLENVCLDQVIVSIISLDGKAHDRIRGKKGCWNKAIQAIEAISRSDVRVIIHFIITRQNYRELPELIERCFQWQINALSLVYPENDHDDRTMLLDGRDIMTFREEVLPRAVAVYRRLAPNRSRDQSNLEGLFSGQGIEGADFSRGRYWGDRDTVDELCRKPETFALVYPNGDFMPCNAVEYSHHPVVGNILRSSLRDIWNGAELERFRRERMSFCLHCPVMRHTGISISTTDNPPYAAPVVMAIPGRLPGTRPEVRERFLAARGMETGQAASADIPRPSNQDNGSEV